MSGDVKKCKTPMSKIFFIVQFYGVIRSIKKRLKYQVNLHISNAVFRFTSDLKSKNFLTKISNI